MYYSINSYQDYLNCLLMYKKQHGGMTDSMIYDFLAQNELPRRYGITFQDVKFDLRNIENETKDFRLSAPALNEKGGIPGKVGKNVTYRMLITEWAKIGNKLTFEKLDALIKSNRLDKKYGLTVADVVADIKEYVNDMSSASVQSQPAHHMSTHRKDDSSKGKGQISKKSISSRNEYQNLIKKYYELWHDSAFAEGKIKLFFSENNIVTSNSNMSDFRIDLAMISGGQVPVSKLAMSFPVEEKHSEKEWFDKEFEKELKHVWDNYGHMSNNLNLFRGVLWDFFPNKRVEVNIIIKLLELGIEEESSKRNGMDELTIIRYSERLYSELGIDKSLSKSVIVMLCNALGKD